MKDRGHFATEKRNPRSMGLGEMTIAAAFDVINTEDATVPAAVAAARHEICEATELVAAALRCGGRLIYVGAGTSGRLGVLDATECPPTFLTPRGLVLGIIAGGPAALTDSVEGAEDRPEGGEAALADAEVGPGDVVFGIATGGTTPFVHGALRAAKARGAKTVFLACVPREQQPDDADVSIRVLTGPEVLTGSTRMKAGTATKMVLNMVSTIAMVQLGKVYENLMIDVNTKANAKLVDRGARILCELTGLDRGNALALLDAAGGRVKTALVMHSRGVDQSAAEEILAAVEGHVGRLLACVRRAG